MIRILLVSNKADVTTDFIVKKLTAQNAAYYRLNTEEIGQSIQVLFDFGKNKFFVFDLISKIEIDLLQVTSVYFRRPEIYVDDKNLTHAESNFKKSELLFTLEGLYRILKNAFWLNNIYDIRNAENKIYQLQLAKEIGLNIPNSIITNQPAHAYDFYKEQNEYAIIKPIKSGLIEGINEEGVVFTNKVHLDDSNVERISNCPVYLQSLIDKKGDIRITLVGDELFPAFIDSQQKEVAKIDWRKSPVPLPHERIELPSEITAKCFDLARKLQLNFAAIDFILDKENNYVFLEINPNGQWAWIERQLNYKISDKITSILIEKSIN